MTQSERSPEDWLPLTSPVFHILLALSSGEEQHGYGIMQEVARSTSASLHLGPGTLYGAIKRMLEGGLIIEKAHRLDPALDDERRRYYQITELGRQVAQAEANRLAELVDMARARRLLDNAGPVS